MKPRIGNMGWIILYVLTGIIDLTQFLIGIFEVPLSAFAIGLVLIAMNEAADPVIGVLLAGYFQWRRISMIKHLDRLFSLIGVFGLDELTGGIASFWIVDIWYMRASVKKEDAVLKTQLNRMEMMKMSMVQPRYAAGGSASVNSRIPTSTPPQYDNGSRRPQNMHIQPLHDVPRPKTGDIRPPTQTPTFGQTINTSEKSISA